MSSTGMVLGSHTKLGVVDTSVILTLGKWRWENQRPQFRLLACLEVREEPGPRLEGHRFFSLKNSLLRHQQMLLGVGRSERQQDIAVDVMEWQGKRRRHRRVKEPPFQVSTHVFMCLEDDSVD